jgi:hypothetical protein
MMHTVPIDINVRPEKYFYRDLVDLDPWAKLQNAENYAMLAMALYMADWTWIPIVDESEKEGLTPRAGFGSILHQYQRPTRDQLGPHGYFG